jgi:hypothetical protein
MLNNVICYTFNIFKLLIIVLFKLVIFMVVIIIFSIVTNRLAIIKIIFINMEDYYELT